MPRRALRCCVDLNIHSVSAPGVWLPSKEDVYISVCLLGHYKVSRLLSSVFPLIIHEKFFFQKTFYTAVDPAEVSDYLEDELVIIELLQLSEYTDGAVRLASYSACARDFLFPYPTLAPTYSSTDRELLLTRSVAFPGISPKLEFSTKTVIKESLSAELDSLEDALEQERGRRTSRRHPSPVHRPRSTSLGRKVTTDLNDTLDTRPPFVIRKYECGGKARKPDVDLISRVPGGGPDTHGKSRTRKIKGLTSSKSDTCLHSANLCTLCKHCLCNYGTLYPGHTKYYHEKSYHHCWLSNPWCNACVFKNTVCRSLNSRCCCAHRRCRCWDSNNYICTCQEEEEQSNDMSYKSKYEDEEPAEKNYEEEQDHKEPAEEKCVKQTVYEESVEKKHVKHSDLEESVEKKHVKQSDHEDAEVSDLTSRNTTSTAYKPRTRSASPILSRPSFNARYGSSPPYYYYYPYYYSSYADYLRRKLDNLRWERLSDPLYPYYYYPYYSPYRRYLYDPLYDLELSTRLAKIRSYLY